MRFLLNIVVKRSGAQFLLALVLILVLKWHTLLEPPVWDTAMALFPAAITLAGNNFDFVELLRMPDYEAGGPNNHGTSLVTVSTALVLKLFGAGPASFIALHLLHFAVAALALVMLFRFARPMFGRGATAWLCLSALLYPVFSTQVGYLYMDMPFFLCAVAALLAWMNQRFWVAVGWSTLACAIKEPGVIVPAALVCLTLLETRSLPEKAKRIGQIVILPVVLTLPLSMLTLFNMVGESSYHVLLPSFGEAFVQVIHYSSRFLFNVPDLLFFVVFFLASASMYGGKIVRTLRNEPSDPSTRNPEQQDLLLLGYSGVLIGSFLLFFFVALPLVMQLTIVLPRYFVVIFPFLLIWFGYGLKRLFQHRFNAATAACFLLLAIFFAINTNGVLYPSDVDTEGPGNDPALTERSNAYRRLLALQLEAMRFIEALPKGTLVYYGHYEHYLFTYPELGYVSAPLLNGHNVLVESMAELTEPGRFSACIYALYNYPWLGGENIDELLGIASRREDLSSEVLRVFEDPPYKIILYRIRAIGADCPV